jgi:hypothetical protein
MRNRTANFKIPVLALVPVLVFLASCEFPQSARIKASPSLRIPIPLGNGENNSFIRSYISAERVQEQLKGDGGGKTPKVYNYALTAEDKTNFGIGGNSGSDPIQTYLITYPLFDMSLDFDEYLNGTPLDTDEDTDESKRVPNIVITDSIAGTVNRAMQMYPTGENGLSYTYWIDPFQGKSPEVDLGDMKNLLSDITFKSTTSFIINVTPQNAEDMKKALRIRIPQLKIGNATDTSSNSWVTGELNTAKTELEFKSSGIDTTDVLLLPQNGTDLDKEKITIHVRLVNKIGAGNYPATLNFDWNSANITPNNDNKRTGEFKGLELGSYLKDLGSGVKFEKIYAYFNIEAPQSYDDFKVAITSAQGSLIEGTVNVELGGEIDIVGRPVEDAYPEWLLSDAKEYIDFTDALTGKDAIKYTITPPKTAMINYDDLKDDNSPKITATLVILLPMSFTFTPVQGEEKISIPTEKENGGTYLPVKFQGLDDFLGGGEGDDDKGSVMGEIDDVLGEGGLTNLQLNLSITENNATSSIYLGVEDTEETTEWQVLEIAKNNSKSFQINARSLSSIPSIRFLVKAGDDGNGRLYIKSQAAGGTGSVDFKVKISVEADVNVDKSIDL